MPSVSDLIHSSFRLIGAVAAGEILETNELNDALVSLNQMIQSWNTEGASLVSRQPLYLTFQTGVGQQTLPTRPIKIEAANMAIGAITCPLEIVDAVGYENIPEKQMLSAITKKLYCDYLYPTSTVYVWPMPRLLGNLELWMYAPLLQFTSLAQVIDLAPGYEMALRYNFAVALLPEYPRSAADPSLPAQAQAYKASLVALNAGNWARTGAPNPANAVTVAAQQSSS